MSLPNGVSFADGIQGKTAYDFLPLFLIGASVDPRMRHAVFPGRGYSNILVCICARCGCKVFTNLILIIAYYPHFTGGDTETQKDEVTHPRSRSYSASEPALGPDRLARVHTVEPVEDAACSGGCHTRQNRKPY